MAEASVSTQIRGDITAVQPRLSGPSRKTFVIAFSKTQIDLEKKYLEALVDGRIKAPSIRKMISEGVVEQDGKRIIIDEKRGYNDLSNMLLLMDCVLVKPIHLHRTNAERLSVIKQLDGLGHQVFVAHYKLPGIEYLLKRASPYARTFSARYPVIATAMNGKTKELPSSIFWTRDLWYRFNGKRIMKYTKDCENQMGEGGRLVPIGQNATLASEVLRGHPTIRELEAQGHRFYFLKDGILRLPKLSQIYGMEVYKTIDHVDLFAGVAGNAMLIDPRYFVGFNKTVLSQAARDNRLEMLFVPPEESDILAPNFLTLGDRKVLMNKAARKSAELLRRNGIEVIATNVELKGNVMAGGGIRCFTNEL